MAKELVAMLLAGGQGSRLYALTQKLAKPAVPFGGKYRIIDFPLSNCVNSGIDTVGILTQYQPFVLNEYIGNGQPWDLDRLYGGVHVLPPYQKASGSDWYKGTANAIYQNIAFIERYDPEYVIILSGDQICKQDYSDFLKFHKEKNAEFSVAVMEVPWEDASRFGLMVADDDDKITEFQEKPKNPKSNLASMGIYIFNWDILKKYLIEDENDPDSENDFGNNIIPNLLRDDRRMYAYHFNGYWKDVGTIPALWEANMEVLDPEHSGINLFDTDWKIYSRNSGMTGHRIMGDAVVENSMITDDVQTMLFEAACFDGTNIRKSSKKIGLRTDASGKFEKGLDPNNAEAAIDRACQLMEELGAGEVVGGMVDVCNDFSEQTFPKKRCLDISGRSIWNSMKRQAKSSHLLSVMTYSASPTLRKRLQDSTDMITFRPHFQVEKLQQENYHSS